MADNLLIVSGLDPSGGAGFIADVRVAAEHGLRPVGVISALTEQDTNGVRAVEVSNPERVDGQLRAILTDLEVSAVKIGMLGDDTMCRVVSAALDLTAAPLVWDPIVRPTRGGVALFSGDVSAAAAELARHLTLITPNIAEAQVLADASISSVDDMSRQAKALSQRFGCAVLITGGHLGGDSAVDVLADTTGTRELSAARIPDAEHTHGTGCALSTSIACGLAGGASLDDAVAAAKAYVADKLTVPSRPGCGSPAVA